ncbi:lysylphosphatidylglycerol synthase transmembrane domain-containing protein [Actinomyces sp. MRS3W]|uniref:lysylphosphatidylglycerol synthase transmembrane domain-containing protein n=1 Tax=Actinomyces sp. MRS3W TaxID=2800796 RepID=UPI0028FD4449|nr:lysylphosphatidylglycerol synthase transmembrane domain-containing protein [Actinomyces sp. MRS3W]MDU0348406.1 lysylphosphatidylglycerol synthase transmembrane domain-containing protein [Actinomyces sp. MRS3W]
MTDVSPPENPERVQATSPVGIPRIGVTPAVDTSAHATHAPATTVPRSTTLLVDAPARRLRRAEDLLDLALTALGLGFMLILAAYAHATTTGVTQDVQNALAVVLRRVLVFPLQAVEGLVTFIVPVVIILYNLLRRAWRTAGEALLAGAGGFALAWLCLHAVDAWGPSTLAAGLTVTASGSARIGISTVFATLAGLLTGAGERRSSPVVRHTWTAVWIVVGLSVLRSAMTLPGAVISILLGRLAGLLVRYAFGVNDNRAHGVALVRALRRAGIDAVRVVRMDRAPDARAWTVQTEAPLGYTERVRETPLTTPTALDDVGDGDAASPDAPPAPDPTTPVPPEDTSTMTPADDVDLAAVLDEASSAALTGGQLSAHRLYAVWDAAGVRRDVTVMDSDRQVAGFLATIWDRARVKGLSPERDMSVRSAAEHAALMMLEASRVGVRTPSLFGMAEADESVLLVTDHVTGARSLNDLDEVDDDILTQLWDQVSCAHTAGLAHRQIDSSSVVVDAAGRVWLLGWDSGETISSELSRRVDLAQALALTASLTDVKRAIAAASRSLSTQQLASIAPMLQRVVLPGATREAMGRRGRVLQELRDALVDLTPTAHAEPAKLTRFSPRTVIMAVVGLVALWTLLARMNIEQITDAVTGANIWWILGALVFSLATYIGAGLALVAFSPVKLSVWKSTEVHLASSVVSLVAPAGVGGAAINLRFLSRKGVPTALGVATVALVQVVQFLVTVVLLIIVAATTGQSAGLTLPSGWVLLTAVILVAVIAAALFVPKVRTWVWAKIEPTYRQVWPRLVWVMSNPGRLALGICGTLLLTLSYILSFGASLWAFGHTLSFSVLAITYLAANTVGSVVPSPGGIGPVEVALTAGLVTAGVPSGVALSTAIVYRLVTFWIPIPVGWLSLQRLQKRGDL